MYEAPLVDMVNGGSVDFFFPYGEFGFICMGI